MNLKEINERNKHIAAFLGWWQDEPDERPYTWWEYNGLSKTSVGYELTFHKDWNKVMLAVEAITQLPTVSENLPKDRSKYVLLDELKISRVGFYLTAYKDSTNQGQPERISFLYMYLPAEPGLSNASSYIEATWLGVSDFCKIYNDHVGHHELPMKRHAR